MNPQTLSIALVVAATSLAVVRPATADTVIMSNGDRLSGEVVREEGGQLKLKTDYAGVLEIEWEKVSRVDLDEPAPVLLDNERVVTIESVSHDGDRLVLNQPPPEQPITIEAPKVKVIEPEPWELGNGHQFKGRVNLSLENVRGNSQSQDLGLDYELSYRRLRHELETYGELNYNTTRDVKSADNWSLNNKYNRFFKDSSWYGSVWLKLKHDYFADLRLRYIVGPALGYKFFEEPGLNLRAEIGPVYLNEDFYEQDDTQNWGPALFLDYDQNFWDDHLQLYHRNMGYVSFGADNPNLWTSWTGVRMPMSWGVVGGLEYEINYNSKPAPGTETTDTTLRLKLGYEW